MRIAYVAPYQGRGLMQRRPTLQNLALAGNLKIELISQLLRGRGHNVEILSQGEVVERRLKLYPALAEPEPFDRGIPVQYASALPVRFVNGLWSSWRTLSLLKSRHRASPFDLIIIYNLKQPQVACARHARQRLRLPVVLEYEDDASVSLGGQTEAGLVARLHVRRVRTILKTASGCIGVSPHLLSQVTPPVPKVLLRGVVSEEVLEAGRNPAGGRNKWIVYSGTHFRSKGLDQLIAAWKTLELPGWELHIAGHGERTDDLQRLAADDPSIVFHGLLDRAGNAELLGRARIGMNPHDLSRTPGNVFAFKIIEYLAAGLHVISTPMGELEKALEAGITYMPDNRPETIVATLKQVIAEGEHERRATQAAHDRYGPEAVSRSLDDLLREVVIETPARPAG